MTGLPFDLGKAFACDLGRTVDEAPAKPGVPMLLPCALLLWAAAAAVYAAFEAADARQVMHAAVGLGCACAACVVLAAAVRRRGAVLVAFLVAGAALGAAASCSYHMAAASLPEGRQHVVLELVSDERSSAFGAYCSARYEVDDGRSGKAIVFFDEAQGLLAGCRLSCDASFSPVSEDYRTRSYFAGEVAQVDAEELEVLPLDAPFQAVYDLRSRAVELLALHGGGQAGVLQALVCGYRGTIQADGTYEAFKACGLAHVVAVSGAHLAIVTMVFGWVLRRFKAPRVITLAASLAFVLGYLAFAGVPVSAVRAAAMVTCSLVAGVAGRRNATANSLAVCMLGFLVLDPSSCVSVSLFLSAASTLGIVLFASLVASWMGALPALLRASLAEPVGLTLSSNLLTMPFSAAAFGMVPVLSVPANVVAAPLFTGGCVCGLVCTLAGCAVPACAPWAICAASAAAWPLQAFVSWASLLPFACVEVEPPATAMLALSAAAACVLWLAWPRVRGAVFGGAMAACLGVYVLVAFLVPTPAGDAIVMLDVGQGDAFLVRSEGRTLLIDTGNEDRMLRDALALAGIRRLDAVAVTHPDADHCASLGSLSAYAEVGMFLCAKPMLECGCSKCVDLVAEAKAVVGEENVVGLSVGDVVDVGRFRMEVLWPGVYEDEGGNADSLCMMARLDSDGDGTVDWRALFTGDAEGDQLDEMHAAGLLEDVDVLKVGHHGSKASLDEEAMGCLRPEVALVSCGKGNGYGHPALDTVAMLEAAGARVVRTDEDGTVTLAFAREGVTLSRQSK